MSIRRTLTYLSGLYAALLVIATACLIIFTTRLNVLTDRVGQALESVYVAEKVASQLLNVSRETLVWRSIDSKEQGRRVAEARKNLLDSIDLSYKFVGSPEELKLLDEAKDNIFRYLEKTDELNRRRASITEFRQERTQFFEEAEERIRLLIELNMAEARDIQKRAEFEDVIGSVVGLVIILLIPPSLYLLWYLVRRAILVPLSRLNESIARYSQGETSLRAAEDGPDEIRRIATTLNSMAETLEQQRDTQLVFVSSVAHDLRNPLGAIKMSVELMADEELTSGPEDRRSLIDLVGRQVSHLDRMVGDLLDMTRVESGHLELSRRPVDLRVLAEDAVTLHRAIATKHDLLYQADEKPIISNCDPLRMSQVLNNLLNNAIKYSPEGGTIVVKAGRSGDRGFITVADQGIGIDPGDYYRIFEPFRRTKKTKATIPGVGLGLSVTKKIVEAHGGTIEVESQVGQGTSFTISLPLASAKPRISPQLVTEPRRPDIDLS